MLTKIEIQYMEAVVGIYQNIRKANKQNIDWEQRRYEIAKNVYPIVIHEIDHNVRKTLPAKAAVELADILIEELKKG